MYLFLQGVEGVVKDPIGPFETRKAKQGHGSRRMMGKYENHRPKMVRRRDIIETSWSGSSTGTLEQALMDAVVYSLNGVGLDEEGSSQSRNPRAHGVTES